MEPVYPGERVASVTELLVKPSVDQKMLNQVQPVDEVLAQVQVDEEVSDLAQKLVS